MRKSLAAIATLAAITTALAPIAQAADSDSIEAAVKATYQSISGPAGPRDWPRFRTLFTDGARLVSIRVANGVPSPIVMTPEEYITRAGANFDKTPFYEAEVCSRVETFGNIAHVFSTYESRRAPGEKPFARGINSFQLVKTAQGWKVLTILWDSEREGNPIPEKYLGGGRQ